MGSRLENPPVETNSERRLRKLKLLCATHGQTKVAEAAGLKPIYLDQILKGVLLPPKKGDGSRSERALGDTAARAIEAAFLLGRGWFDNDGEEETMTPKELRLLGIFRELDSDLQEIVLCNAQEALEQRKRLLERMRLGPASRPNDADEKNREQS